MAPRRNRHQELVDLLAEEDLLIDDNFTEPKAAKRVPDPPADWYPPLGPVGMDVFRSDAKFLLLHGERFSGKTFAGLHRAVKGLFDNDGARACLSTLTRGQAIQGGLWTKFQYVLQAWGEGVQINGKFHEGMGLRGEGKNGEFVFKMDDARNRYVWIQNALGGWSMAFLRSMLHGDQIAGRIKSMEFTTFLYDELTDTDDEEYFTKPIQQLYRITGVKPQQFIGCCNPPDTGEDHWVYKRFFTEFDDPKAKVLKRRTDYAVFHVPISDNQFVDDEQKQATLDNVREEARTDPTAIDRLILGKWVKKPSGKGLFAEWFRRQLHVRGSVEKQQYIIPAGNVIDIGYDIGTANTAITFEERLLTVKGELYSWFDEIVLVEKYVPIPQVAPMLLGRMNYWCGRTGRPLFFNHIADAGSFDQMRPDGSYDARKLEQEVAKELKEHPERYPHLRHIIYVNPSLPPAELEFREQPIRLRPCPKPDGSVSSRVKMMIARLQSELIVVSARCTRHIEMFENLPVDPDKPYHPPKTSRYKHAFDSSTYPVYHYEMGGYTASGHDVPTGRLSELRP